MALYICIYIYIYISVLCLPICPGFLRKTHPEAMLAYRTRSEHSSFGYHNDGSVYHGSASAGIKFGPRFGENDTVGCGVDFMSRSLFFTRNGVFLGKAFEGKVPASPATRLYPAVGLMGRGARLTTNFGQRPFSYAFESYINRERVFKENSLIDRVCKEEFAGPKMRELVSGYLVHHGYVATAQAFSRWASVALSVTDAQSDMAESPSPLSATTNQSPIHYDKPPIAGGLQSRSCDSHLGSQQVTGTPEVKPPKLVSIARRHSDSSCIAPTNPPMHQLPGITSMLHRRRLRALCRRCQYGRAAATLNHLYPQVLERCPELLVQLRCRQLIEMMRRHAMRRGRSTAFGSTASDSATAPPKVPKTNSSQHVRSSCCVPERTNKISEPQSLNISENGTTITDMEVDSDQPSQGGLSSNLRLFSLPGSDVTSGQGDSDEDVGVGLDDMDEDEGDDDDDDGFGVDDDTGVCFDSLSSQNGTSNIPTQESTSCLTGMEVDPQPDGSQATAAPFVDEMSKPIVEKSELPCLMRHVQFGRSLVNLVKQVRAKTGGLSLETERLLQQSVSLLAYPSPSAPDCPLRHLLDPAWRDAIANVINSAVLKAHDLPVQPALEQGLQALQHCLDDQYFLEAQTLGHFLLYHLGPSKLAKLERDAAALAAVNQQKVTKRHRSTLSTSHDEFVPSDSTGQTKSRSLVLNGHSVGRRRRRRSDRPTEDPDEGSNDRSTTSSGRTHSDSSHNVGHRLRQFSTIHRPEPGQSRLGRLAILTRYCPTLLVDPAYTRVLAAVPSSTASYSRRLVSSGGTNRVNVSDSPVVYLDPVVRSSTTTAPPRPTRPSETGTPPPPNQYIDSAFNGLLSFYPQPAEFVAAMDAMDDAVKAYVGSLLVTDDEQHLDPTLLPLINRSHRSHPRGDGPPPPAAGGSALA
ncbi:Ran-binding protein 10 [Clonorchis sinensis]|uniref:Ran-binding protein 10 n=1 Tax=Clonorchis sinensis TaxID=79923 RepID=G7YG05_CLOSI|nr:Ran-binding protein 10 [Clonorchis sinensis]